MSLRIHPLDKQIDNKKVSGIAQAPFTEYIVAGKGSGKSTLLINMLLNPNIYRETFNEIYIVSPTANMDAKFNILRNTPHILKDNAKLRKLLNKLHEKPQILSSDQAEQVKETDGYITNFMEHLDLNTLTSLMEEQKFIIEQFGKKFADQVLIVFDDCVNDKIFNDRKFIDFVFKSRHYKISCIFISQSYYRLPKSLRLNNTSLLLFENSNEKELKGIYEENSVGTYNQFLAAYNEIMKTPFAFFNWNYQNPKKNRCFMNFEQKIEF